MEIEKLLPFYPSIFFSLLIAVCTSYLCSLLYNILCMFLYIYIFCLSIYYYCCSKSYQSKKKDFADDCLIYRNIKSKQHQITLQNGLYLLENQGNTWGMCFNATKCNIMRVSRTCEIKRFDYLLTGQVLEEVMDTKYLGVTHSND